MRLRRACALVGAVTATVFAACKEPAFAPRWDADMYLPLSTHTIHLTPAVIPAGLSATDSFPVQQQDVSGVLGDVLKNVTDPSRCTSATNPAQSCDLVTLTATKSTAVSVQDTLYISDSSVASAPRPGMVPFPISMAVTDQTKTFTDTLANTTVTMLKNAGESGRPLYILLRGSVANPSASPLTVTVADSIQLSLSATIRVAVVHK
ncbi:MAG TPA: hypothetical protein VEH83_12880 [Gemmatimonadales bacterium]|nr:hypothetical protein [Gemmatimonadales bacterium]